MGMKRLIPLAALLLAAATPLFALDDTARTDRTDQNRRIVIVDDVIRMSQAGVSDDAIISYVEKSREPFDLSADDIIAMTDAHVSKDVIKAVVDESAARKDRRRYRDERVYVAPGYYDPWLYPYYYDPFWYGPRFGVGVGFGFGPRFGRGFHHGRR
jgi:hypothetical protein